MASKTAQKGTGTAQWALVRGSHPPDSLLCRVAAHGPHLSVRHWSAHPMKRGAETPPVRSCAHSPPRPATAQLISMMHSRSELGMLSSNVIETWRPPPFQVLTFMAAKKESSSSAGVLGRLGSSLLQLGQRAVVRKRPASWTSEPGARSGPGSSWWEAGFVLCEVSSHPQDAAGFSRSERAKQLARLSPEEINGDVWC